jgi:hypothetical protein
MYFMLDIERLKVNYTSDLDPDLDLIDEAIATIEGVANYNSEEQIYHRERPLMIAYLALIEAKNRLNRP